MVTKAKEELKEKQKQQQQQQQPVAATDGITGQQPGRQPIPDSQTGQQPQVGLPIVKFIKFVLRVILAICNSFVNIPEVSDRGKLTM
jgi:hypothetical protein